MQPLERAGGTLQKPVAQPSSAEPVAVPRLPWLRATLPLPVDSPRMAESFSRAMSKTSSTKRYCSTFQLTVLRVRNQAPTVSKQHHTKESINVVVNSKQSPQVEAPPPLEDRLEELQRCFDLGESSVPITCSESVEEVKPRECRPQVSSLAFGGPTSCKSTPGFTSRD